MAQMALQAVENGLAFETLAFIGAINDVVRAHQSLIRKRHFSTLATEVWIKYGAMKLRSPSAASTSDRLQGRLPRVSLVRAGSDPERSFVLGTTVALLYDGGFCHQLFGLLPAVGPASRYDLADE